MKHRDNKEPEAGMEWAKPLFGHLAALFTITVWGITFISIKVLLEAFSPVEIMFYRLFLAVLALNAVRPPLINGLHLGAGLLRDEWMIVAAGFCGVTLYMLFQNIAISYTQAANVSVLLSVAPLFVALASWVFLNEKLKAHFFLGFIIAIAGIILIAFNGSLVQKLNPLGDLLSIMAALVWAFYSVLIKKISTLQPDMLVVTRKIFSYGLLLLLPFLPVAEFRLGPERLANAPDLLNLIFLGVVASAVCFVTWNYAVHTLGPVKTSVYIYLIPLIAATASVVLLGEIITLVSGIGMAMILIGMVFSETERRSLV